MEYIQYSVYYTHWQQTEEVVEIFCQTPLMTRGGGERKYKVCPAKKTLDKLLITRKLSRPRHLSHGVKSLFPLPCPLRHPIRPGPQWAPCLLCQPTTPGWVLPLCICHLPFPRYSSGLTLTSSSPVLWPGIEKVNVDRRSTTSGLAIEDSSGQFVNHSFCFWCNCQFSWDSAAIGTEELVSFLINKSSLFNVII